MYKHTQIGYVVILAVIAVMLGILAKVVFQGPDVVPNTTQLVMTSLRGLGLGFPS